VGYACGRVRFVNEGGSNQEGLYWRYEMWMRGHESALASVTAGNGAIYAVRPEAYLEVDPVMGHDLSFPFNLVKRGWRAVDVPDARATEKMVPSIEGEWARKRRMMSHAWPIVVRGGLMDPRGYPPLYGLMILSHRVLRYATPLLHAVALVATLAELRRGRARAAALAQAVALAAGRRRRAGEEPAAAARPLLRADDRVAGRGSVGLAAPRDARGLGRARGHPVNPYLRSRRKRALDVVGAAVVLALSAPALIAAAIAIRLEGPGHPIYRQRRVGRDGEPFELYKLRTMVTGAEVLGAGLIVDQGDDRITRVGALLRRTSLDELPNLINVLRGEMSLVGPAPDRAGAGRPLHGAPAAAARRPAGHHRVGADQRARLASVGRPHRARPDLPGAGVAAPRPGHPRAQRAHGGHRAGPLPRRDGRLAGAAAPVAPSRGRPPGPCRCSSSGTCGPRRTPCRSSPGM
jgi:hypothetical protein